MSKKLTPWFPPSVKPARAGVYKTKEPNNMQWFNYFNGLQWYLGSHNPTDALHVGPFDLLNAEWFAGWRGLAEQPKGARRA